VHYALNICSPRSWDRRIPQCAWLVIERTWVSNPGHGRVSLYELKLFLAQTKTSLSMRSTVDTDPLVLHANP